MAELIRRLDKENPHDFYFPLDCDEYLACLSPEGSPSCLKQDIHKVLEPYLVAEKVLVVCHKYWSNILFPNLYTINTSSKKCFFARGACRSLDHGFHHATTLRGDAEVKTGIIYFEFHYRTYAYHRTTNRQKLIGLIPDFSRNSLRDYAKKGSHGGHCARDLLQSKYAYMKSFRDSTDLVAAPALLATFDALGIDYANLFESRNAILRAWNRTTLRLRHELSRRLSFLTDRLYRIQHGVAVGLKGGFRRLRGWLRG